jgi:hypothetical protein
LHNVELIEQKLRGIHKLSPPRRYGEDILNRKGEEDEVSHPILLIMIVRPKYLKTIRKMGSKALA